LHQDLCHVFHFSVKVDLIFSKTTVEPRDNVSLTIYSTIDSYVGLLGVDKSVKIFKNGNNTASRIGRTYSPSSFDRKRYHKTKDHVGVGRAQDQEHGGSSAKSDQLLSRNANSRSDSAD
jgi:Alpha-2-macroglobulin bait region domain